MQTRDSRFSWTDILLTALAPAIWGSTYIVTTELLPAERPFTAALLRVLPAGILLVLFSGKNLNRGGWARLIVLSALNIGFFQALLFVAAYRLPGGLAAVVGAIQPLLVMAMAWGIDQRQPALRVVIACCFGVIGMAALLLSSDSGWDPLGILAALAGTASMAAGTFLAQRWRTDMPLLAFTGWQLLIGGLMLLPVAWLLDPPLPALSAFQLLGYIYLSLFGALLAYGLWFRGVARLPAEAVSSLGLLSPLTAVVLGWTLLGQVITGFSMLGLIAVLASVVIVQWSSGSGSQSKTVETRC